jgi:chromosome partitioning protein
MIIGVCNRKGGSGKTTAAVHLVGELASRGFKVELVDCDDQGSAAQWAAPGRLPARVRLLPLEETEGVEDWARSIRQIEADYVVLDSPSRFGPTLGGVIALSDLVLIPSGPSALDLRATSDTVELVRAIRRERRKTRPSILLIPNRADWRTLAGRDLHRSLEAFGEPVASGLRSRLALAESFELGLWAGAHVPQAPAHQEVIALTNSVLREVAKLHSRSAAA